MAKTIAVLLLCACALAQVVEFADCELRPVNGSGVSGYVRFTRAASDQMVTVVANVQGLPATTPAVAIHVHTWGDVSDVAGGLSAGGHFVGAGSPTHGCPPSITRHEGDMGNWTVSGTTVTQQFDLLAMTGLNSIIGRAVIVHSKTDDCISQPTGAAGGRLAQCVIGIGNMTTISASGSNAASVTAASTPLTLGVCDLTSGPAALGLPHGSVYFVRESGGVRVIGQFSGINGTHGLHIHTSGDLSSPTFVSAGGHWNPKNVSHGMPTSKTHHAGDLGNVQTYDNGIAWYNYLMTDQTDIESLLGRTVILHALFDHGAGYGCDQAGTSGPRYMACVIGVGNSTAVIVPTPPKVDNTWKDVACTTEPPKKNSKFRKELVIAFSVTAGIIVIAIIALALFVKCYWKPGKRPYQSL